MNDAENFSYEELWREAVTKITCRIVWEPGLLLL